MMKDEAVIFNIQHYSLHDGPGIRTVVFFKGCPMRCRWCCNPESQNFHPEISYMENRCIGNEACGWCREICPAGAVRFEEGKAHIDFKKCNGCQKCVNSCPPGAVKAEGQTMSISKILNIVEKDQVFYARGGGGLTISGGEALAQPQVLTALLREAKRRYIHTALETCGQGSYEALAEAAGYLDTLFYDIKIMDSKKHQVYTGNPNKQILSNLERLCTEYPNLPKTVRTPVIPGFNDTEEEIQRIYDFVKELPGTGYELLPYHSFGQGKYHALGRVYEMGSRTLTDRQKDWIEQWGRSMSIKKIAEKVGKCRSENLD